MTFPILPRSFAFLRYSLVFVLSMGFGSAHAFQIAPLGSSFEARMTNEPESTLAKVAGKLGKLVKRPVHEEITNLAFNCPIDLDALPTDEECAKRDAPFATAYVIYGVRWNDLPC